MLQRNFPKTTISKTNMDWVLDDPSMSITEYMSHRENFLGSNHIKGSEAFETCTKDTIYYCFPRRNEKKMCPLSVHYAGRPLPVYIQSIKKINYTGKVRLTVQFLTVHRTAQQVTIVVLIVIR